MDSSKTIKFKTIKSQLLTRAMHQPSIAKHLVGDHVVALFGNDMEFNRIAWVVTEYYYHHQSQLTEHSLNALLDDKVDDLVKSGTLTKDQGLQYFRDADSILSDKIDTSDEMTIQLNHFIHTRLGKDLVVKVAAKGKRHPDTYNFVKALKDGMSKIDTIDLTGQGNQVIDIYQDYVKEHEALKELNKDKVPMGIANIDKATSHGLAKGEVGLIGASSGGGKTTVLTQFSVAYTKMGYNVMHISLEELSSQMILRFIRVALGDTPKDLFDDKGHMAKQSEKTVYTDFWSMSHDPHKNLGRLSFYRTSPRTITVDGVRQLIESSERLHHVKYDVVVLDYPDLLLNTYQTGNESEDGGRMFQDLRKMAQDLHVVLWTATQLNRMSGIQQVKTMDAIEGSYRKINTVEFAATVNRTKTEWQHGFMRLKIDKLRNRMDYQGTALYFKYDPLTMRLRSETDSELQQHQQLLNETSSDNKMSFRKKKRSERIKRHNEANRKMQDQMKKMIGDD